MLALAHLALGDAGAANRTLERAERHAMEAGRRGRARLLGERREGLGAP
jgi:hypothetical protein